MINRNYIQTRNNHIFIGINDNNVTTIERISNTKGQHIHIFLISYPFNDEEFFKESIIKMHNCYFNKVFIHTPSKYSWMSNSINGLINESDKCSDRFINIYKKYATILTDRKGVMFKYTNDRMINVVYDDKTVSLNIRLYDEMHFNIH